MCNYAYSTFYEQAPATLHELKNALRVTLEDKGVLSGLRAQIRSEIFSCLDEDDALKPRSPLLLKVDLVKEF